MRLLQQLLRQLKHLLVKNNKKKYAIYLVNSNNLRTFALAFKEATNMVPVVQLVRASDCGSECRGFESHRAPCQSVDNQTITALFLFLPPK